MLFVFLLCFVVTFSNVLTALFAKISMPPSAEKLALDKLDKQQGFSELKGDFRHLAVAMFAKFLLGKDEYRAPGVEILKWIVESDDAADVWCVMTLKKYAGSKLDITAGDLKCTTRSGFAEFVLEVQNTYKGNASIVNTIRAKFQKGADYDNEELTESVADDDEEDLIEAVGANPMVESITNNPAFESLEVEFRRLSAILMRAVQDQSIVGQPVLRAIRWTFGEFDVAEICIYKFRTPDSFSLTFRLFAEPDLTELKCTDLDGIVQFVASVQESTSSAGNLSTQLDEFVETASVESGSSGSSALVPTPIAEPAAIASPSVDVKAEVRKRLREIEEIQRAEFHKQRIALEAGVPINDKAAMNRVYTKALDLSKKATGVPENIQNVYDAFATIEDTEAFLSNWLDKNPATSPTY